MQLGLSLYSLKSIWYNNVLSRGAPSYVWCSYIFIIACKSHRITLTPSLRKVTYAHKIKKKKETGRRSSSWSLKGREIYFGLHSLMKLRVTRVVWQKSQEMVRSALAGPNSHKQNREENELICY